jgi:hypothetical protein
MVCVCIFRFIVVLSVLRKEYKGHYMFMVAGGFYFEHADNPHKDVMARFGALWISYLWQATQLPDKDQ